MAFDGLFTRLATLQNCLLLGHKIFSYYMYNGTINTKDKNGFFATLLLLNKFQRTNEHYNI